MEDNQLLSEAVPRSAAASSSELSSSLLVPPLPTGTTTDRSTTNEQRRTNHCSQNVRVEQRGRRKGKAGTSSGRLIREGDDRGVPASGRRVSSNKKNSSEEAICPRPHEEEASEICNESTKTVSPTSNQNGHHHHGRGRGRRIGGVAEVQQQIPQNKASHQSPSSAASERRTPSGGQEPEQYASLGINGCRDSLPLTQDQEKDTLHESSSRKKISSRQRRPKRHSEKDNVHTTAIPKSSSTAMVSIDGEKEMHKDDRLPTSSVEPATLGELGVSVGMDRARPQPSPPPNISPLPSSSVAPPVKNSRAATPGLLVLPTLSTIAASNSPPGMFLLSRSSSTSTPILTNVAAVASTTTKTKKKKRAAYKKSKKLLHGEEEEPEAGCESECENDETGDVNEYATDDVSSHKLINLTGNTHSEMQVLPSQKINSTSDAQIKILLRNARNDESSTCLTTLIPVGSNGNKDSSKQHPQAMKTKKSVVGARKSDGQKKFNTDVRLCLEQSDPDRLRSILRDKKNHKYCLDDTVLEIVLVASVMAAMFEDALYCLRNCTRPAVLSIYQTEHILSCMPQNLRNSSAYTAADMISQLCVATHFEPAAHRSYFLRIVRGVALEFLEEAISARDRICSSACERLVRSGLCVVDARLERGKKASEIVVFPGDQLGCFIPEGDQRGIATGDAVSLLPYAGPYPMSAESLDRNMIEATVINTSPIVLRLQDKMNSSLHSMLIDPAEGNVYRIDKLANRMGFNRQLAAAVSISSPVADTKVRDQRRPCPELVKAITAMDENIVSLMHQSKNGILPKGQVTSTAALCAEAIPWSLDDEGESFDQETAREAARLALEKYNVSEGLNPSQRLAVEGATTNRITLVQGPPGTGKTNIAVKILQHWARLAEAAAPKNGVASPILATSDSNIAVDNLVEGCASVGLRVVRLGRPEAIRPELLKYCIDKSQPSYSSDRKCDATHSTGYGYASPGAAAMAQKERLKQLKSAQVICCTCIGSGSEMLDHLGPLEHVLVDEATQATEPAVLVPLMRGCRQLVLVGDHCQLPPTVLSTRAEEEGHGVPLFSRMVACGVPPFMLDTQYRMHPCIAMFPSDLFYGGRLNNGVSSAERRPLVGFPWPREEFPVAFVPVSGDEFDDGVSKYNEAEAAAACDAVAALLDGGQCSKADIAVVTPYAAQARLIRRQLRNLLPDNGPPYVEVSSVDGFQGREKEAVVFSAVRSNSYGAIGFTSDWRRVNVSFTRARRALIVIGNDVTLRRGDPDTWSPWLAWVDAYGLNMGKPGIPRGRYEPELLRRVRGGTTAAEMLKGVLERQQAQLMNAERQQVQAEKNTRGLVGSSESSNFHDVYGAQPGSEAARVTLEEDLALMENVDGNWDDSDDDAEPDLRHSISKATLSSACSSNDLQSSNESTNAVNIWDL